MPLTLNGQKADAKLQTIPENSAHYTAVVLGF